MGTISINGAGIATSTPVEVVLPQLNKTSIRLTLEDIFEQNFDSLIAPVPEEVKEALKEALEAISAQLEEAERALQELLTGAIAAIKDMVRVDAARVLEDIQQKLQKNNELSPEAIQKLVTSGIAAIKDMLPAEVAAALEAALQAMQQDNFPEVIQKVREVVESFLPAISGECLKCAVDVATYCSEQELPPTPPLTTETTTTEEFVSVFSACTGRESLLWLVLVGVMVGKP